MPALAFDRHHQSRPLLIAALDALDREGDAVAAAYVAMALSRIAPGDDAEDPPA